MQVHLFENYHQLNSSPFKTAFVELVSTHPQGNYFQSIDFLELCEGLSHFEAFALLLVNGNGSISGSLTGVIQTSGTGLKSWFSRRLIVWGGPLIPGKNKSEKIELLLKSLKEHATGKAIFIEFRNLFEIKNLRSGFEAEGFQYQPYLNFLVKTDYEAAVLKRMHANRRRKIRKSLRSGASVREADSLEEVEQFYGILENLYQTRVKKPLPGITLFRKLWESPTSKVFVVIYNDRVVGGAACPTFNQKMIYDWFRCGQRNVAKGVFSGVLAAWAPMQFALEHNYEYLDFMGAGKPDESYGVRDFKAHFGGEEVEFGRFITVLNRPLFNIGKLGLKMYQQLHLKL